MTGKLLDIIGNELKLTPVDCGEFATRKVSGMNFRISAWNAEGFGRVSLMQVSGMLGLMKMQTLIVNPFEVDAPLLSYDRIEAMGNDTLMLEPFDTTLGTGSFDESALVNMKANTADLPDRDAAPCWYDGMRLPSTIDVKCKKKDTARLDEITESYFEAYLRAAKAAASCDPEAKKIRAAAYSNGLIDQGGPATDPFVKTYGAENTREFFRTVLFGV